MLPSIGHEINVHLYVLVGPHEALVHDLLADIVILRVASDFDLQDLPVDDIRRLLPDSGYLAS